jgi:hypothetical protein
MHFTPTPIVTLNRAVAIAEVNGPQRRSPLSMAYRYMRITSFTRCARTSCVGLEGSEKPQKLTMWPSREVRIQSSAHSYSASVEPWMPTGLSLLEAGRACRKERVPSTSGLPLSRAVAAIKGSRRTDSRGCP